MPMLGVHHAFDQTERAGFFGFVLVSSRLGVISFLKVVCSAGDHNVGIKINDDLGHGCELLTVQYLDGRIESLLHVGASFGVNISIFLKMEVLMDLNVILTSLVTGVALLRRSGDDSEIRRGKAWSLTIRNPRVRATGGSIPSIRISF